MIIIHDVQQGTDEWLKLREGLWTGSIAHYLMRDKPMPVFKEWGGNDATRRGHMLEEVAMQEYARMYGRKPTRPGFVTNTVYPNAGYSPDGFDGGWLLESKAFRNARHEALVQGNIPLEVLVQIFFGMIITGKRKARLLAINPECEQQLTVTEIEYDKKIGSNIRKKLRADMKKRLT